MNRLFLTLMLFFMFVLPVGAQTTYWVAATGGSTGSTCADIDGESDPGVYFRTLSAGYGCLTGNDGDTLIIKAGTYAAASVAGTRSGASDSVRTTIRANTGDEVIILGQTSIGSGASPASYITFDGIIFDGDNSNPAAGTLAIFISDAGTGSHHIRIQNSVIRYARNHGLNGGRSVELIDNEIHHNGQTAALVPTCTVGEPDNPGLCHGVYMNGDGHIVDGNLMHHNTGRGLQLYNTPTNATVRNNISHSNGDGLLINGGSGHVVYNNVTYNNQSASGANTGLTIVNNSNSTIVNNTSYGNDIGLTSSGNTKIIRNNILSGNSTNLTITGTGHTISNNLCSGAATNCAIVEAAATTFVDPGAADFTLKAGSAAIDGGATLSSPYNVDALGIARPQGDGWDVGALELVVTSEPPTWDLDVASVNPASGVTITVSPADNGALTDGDTAFTRNYDDTTEVTLVAPATAGSNTFSAWSNCDSVGGTGNRTCTVTMTTDRTVTATYITPDDPVILRPPTNLRIGSGITWTIGTQ